jgi:DNA-binding XRE family transcriptional regulator
MSRHILPPRVQRGLQQLGADIAMARRRRHLTMDMMAERVGVARLTYRRVEAGDPAVSMGTYAKTLFVLGVDTPFAELADPGRDDQGLLIEAAEQPRRVRVRRQVEGL